jgi:phage gpG-like protein
MQFTMRVDGVVLIDRHLLNVAERIEDAAPAFERIAGLFAEGEKKQFESEGSWGSGTWSPLSPAYASWKLRRFPGTKILERTGALKASLTQRPLGIEQITATRLRIGSGIFYGRYHQDGGPRLPKRPPLAMPEKQRRTITKVLQRYVKTGMVV